MFKICQIIFVLFLSVGIIIYFGKRKRCWFVAVFSLVGILAISAFFSDTVVQCIPLPTDKVTVTATGEKNPQASKNEVSIKGYLVGGKEYQIKNPSEGKWFWQGDVYKWRNEEDPRQPEGTTRSITLNIPYGKDRAVQFYANKWNGIVEVTYHENSQRYDLFSAKDTEVIAAPVGDTESIALYLVKLVRLLLFAGLTLVLIAYPCFVVAKFGNEHVKSFLHAHWSQLVYMLLAVCCFIVMVNNSEKASFWADEIWSLGWYYLGHPAPQGVYALLYDLWFFLMPYGQEYLLIISEIFAAMSVYIAGSIGELSNGKRCGVIMSTLFASSFSVMIQGGSEFRPYALLLFCASGLLYYFIKKQKEAYQKRSTLIIYTVFLVLTMDAHPFGFVFAGLLMIFDFVLILLKRVKPIGLIEFLMPGIYAAYWLSALNTNEMSVYGGGWAEKPSLRGTVSILKSLCNSSDILLSLFFVGLSISLIYLFDRVIWKGSNFWGSYGLLMLVLAPGLLFFLTFLYSYIFNGASVFVSRYFTVLMPIIAFFIAIAINAIIEAFSKIMLPHSKGTVTCTLSCILILCVLNWNMLPNVYAYDREDFRGSAEYLMSQNDIYTSSTICLVYGNEYHNAGFDYYLTQKGKRDPINHVSAWSEIPDNLFEYKTIYCIYHHRSQPDPTRFLERGYIEAESIKSLALKKYVKTDL